MLFSGVVNPSMLVSALLAFGFLMVISFPPFPPAFFPVGISLKVVSRKVGFSALFYLPSPCLSSWELQTILSSFWNVALKVMQWKPLFPFCTKKRKKKKPQEKSKKTGMFFSWKNQRVISFLYEIFNWERKWTSNQLSLLIIMWTIKAESDLNTLILLCQGYCN